MKSIEITFNMSQIKKLFKYLMNLKKIEFCGRFYFEWLNKKNNKQSLNFKKKKSGINLWKSVILIYKDNLFWNLVATYFFIKKFKTFIKIKK